MSSSFVMSGMSQFVASVDLPSSQGVFVFNKREFITIINTKNETIREIVFVLEIYRRVGLHYIFSMLC